jgi:hypothetical protein
MCLNKKNHVLTTKKFLKEQRNTIFFMMEKLFTPSVLSGDLFFIFIWLNFFSSSCMYFFHAFSWAEHNSIQMLKLYTDRKLHSLIIFIVANKQKSLNCIFREEYRVAWFCNLLRWQCFFESFFVVLNKQVVFLWAQLRVFRKARKNEIFGGNLEPLPVGYISLGIL